MAVPLDDLPEFHNDPDVICLNISEIERFIETDAKLIGETIRPALTPLTRVVFNYAFEGQVGPWLHHIYKIIDHAGVVHNKVTFITSALEGVRFHKEYCEAVGIVEPINLYVTNIWERHMMMSHFYNWNTFDAKTVEYCQGPKEKVFLCFNRIFRSHRFALLGLLAERGLVDKAYYSFTIIHYLGTMIYGEAQYITKNEKIDEHLWMVGQHVTTTTLKRIEAGVQKVQLPLTLNSPPQINTNTLIEADVPLFRNSYFSLVTETHFFPNNRNGQFHLHEVFFTEKTYKPIIMKHPFVLLAPAKSLYYLRKLGYQTFAPYINETYDTIEDHEQRLLAVVDEVERLSKKTPEEWATWEAAIAPIVEHNYNVLKLRKPDDYILERS